MTKQKIIKCFNSGAKTYDVAADIQVHAAKELSRYLDLPAKNIVEIGCGTGLFSQELIRKFPGQNILLMDIAPEMIKVTREKFSSYPNVTFACRDGESASLAVKSGQPDLIVSNMTLHWFTDLYQGIKNIIDQLASGGQFIFALLGENTLKEWRKLYPAPTLVFPKHELLRNYFPEMKIHVESQLQSYSNARAFLKTLKNIGGTATHFSNQALTSGNLRSILRDADSSFDVTYEVIYGQYKKP
jgi:malonyl-CoA O-methyltransferase